QNFLLRGGLTRRRWWRRRGRSEFGHRRKQAGDGAGGLPLRAGAALDHVRGFELPRAGVFRQLSVGERADPCFAVFCVEPIAQDRLFDDKLKDSWRDVGSKIGKFAQGEQPTDADKLTIETGAKYLVYRMTSKIDEEQRVLYKHAAEFDRQIDSMVRNKANNQK